MRRLTRFVPKSILSPFAIKVRRSSNSSDLFEFKYTLSQYQNLKSNLRQLKHESVIVPTILTFITGFSGLTPYNTFVISPVFVISAGLTVLVLHHYHKNLSQLNNNILKLKTELINMWSQDEVRSQYPYSELDQILKTV